MITGVVEVGEGEAILSEDRHGGAVPLRSVVEAPWELRPFGQTNANLGVAAGCGWDATGVSFAQYRWRVGKSRMGNARRVLGATPLFFQRVGKSLWVSKLQARPKTGVWKRLI